MIDSRGEPLIGRRTRRMAARLDEPREPPRALLPRPHYDPESFGRLSERIARFLGTARFLVYMTVFLCVWLSWNTLAPAQWRFDPYPFIFLTLILSVQASFAAPLILLAQNRQDYRDRVQYEQDRARNERNIAETEYLTREIAGLRLAVSELATRDYLRSELERVLKELNGERAAKP
ncbi:hypothetical protein Arub01_05270 [Actinomadura rubrobrunea]|uniref:DUF1003 domain-containing protein n=1 Tax=Actinomadura rubrobrunea TaxID=115335 RepID=A0A9W6UTY5_9ACTN|nr:DUF1003 domain-containing protein [Actinomadura rubrobrunea]GLW62283.1 hypothetical protein Arub01_05270 [Actinomadura rubrobrunea]